MLVSHYFSVIDYKPTPFVERDFTEAPKFTTVLNDRSTTVGYSTKLLCSVRGSPKVNLPSFKPAQYWRFFMEPVG